MARQLRIEYPGAFYHVFSRGNQKQPIFLSDEDRCYFLNCLRNAWERFGVIVHVYCLMPNHFHLILETPHGDLSRIMHFLVTSYTVYFNKKYERTGHLFQGRYRSILIEVVSYARRLSCYIHLNPVRSRIVDKPEFFPWSSYGYYRGTAVPEKWLETSVILKLFGDHPEEAVKAYVAFVEQEIGKKPDDSFRKAVRYGILGSEEFIERIRREHLGKEIDQPDREKPQLRTLRKRPDLSRVLSLTEQVLGPRKKYDIPIAILIGHKNSALRLKDIGEFFSMSISSVSNACLKARTALAANPALARATDEIERSILEDGGKEEEGVKPTFFEKK